MSLKAKLRSLKMFFREYPCLGEGTGEDFECLYDSEVGEDCTECLCAWKTFGGRRSPSSKHGKKWPWLICFLLWGLPYTQFPDCRTCKYLKKNTCLRRNVKIEEYKFQCRDYYYRKAK